MESIGLFEAKTHLSELIARAERGEEVIITRHNKGGNFVYHDGHWQNRQVLLGPSGSTSYGGYYKYLPFYNVRKE